MKEKTAKKEPTELMKRLGVSKAEDRKGSTNIQGTINPFEIGGKFLEYCVKQGWLKKDGSKYYSTVKGKKELKKLGINV